MNTDFIVITYNVCWEAMTNTNSRSHPQISNICSNGNCQNNVLKWLDRDYSICCIQEANLDLDRLPLKSYHHVFRSQSGKEPMITIIDESRWKVLKALGYEFSVGRPIQCLLLEDRLTNNILGLINVHAGHHEDNNIFNLSRVLKSELTDWYYLVTALIVAGDFNKEYWPADLLIKTPTTIKAVTTDLSKDLITDLTKDLPNHLSTDLPTDLDYKEFKNNWLLSGLNSLNTCCDISYNNQNEDHKPRKPCDYIAYTSNLRSDDHKLDIISGPASDHHPIIGQFSWN